MEEIDTYDDLPEWVKEKLEAAFPGQGRFVVNDPLPTLGHKSIIETMKLQNGAARMRNYFESLEGKMLI